MNALSKEELIEARELTDVNTNELQLKKSQLIEIMNDCNNEDYVIHISVKLKDVISLEELTPQVLHSLVEKITCTHEGEIHIHYSFVNPLQVA